MQCKIELKSGAAINFTEANPKEAAFKGHTTLRDDWMDSLVYQKTNFISPKNDDWVVPLENPKFYLGEWKEEKKNMKICFYYDNGRIYTATGVTTYRDYQDHVYYNQEKDTGLLKTDSDIEVSKSDLLAYVVCDGNTTTIVKVGNCKLNFDIEDVNKINSKRKVKKASVSPREDGWIVWEGGECPVAEGTLVDVMYGDGWIEKQIPALWVHGSEGRRNAFNWSLKNSDSAIVAYRLSKGD